MDSERDWAQTPAARVALALDRHAERRAAGIPTVSVLVGPTSEGADTWARWVQRSGRRLVRLADGAGSGALATAWVAALVPPPGRPDAAAPAARVRAAAVAWLAGASDDPPETLARRLRSDTVAARRMLVERLIAGRHPPSGRLCLALFGGHDDLGDPAELFPDEPDPALAMVDALHGLCPARSPAVLLVSTQPDAAGLAAAMRLLAGLAERMVEAVIAWALTGADWHAAESQVAESRFKAICREGVIRLVDPACATGPAKDAANLVAWARRHGFREPVFSRLRACLAAQRASLAARATQPPAAQGVRPAVRQGPTAAGSGGEPEHGAPNQDPHGFARSQAEAALYEILRQWPPTADQVRLNATLPIPFGKDHMEVDLLLTADAIAIEVDGYYHFLTVEGYRRDRRKDFLLQRHGRFVLRFHADDVADPAGLDEILIRIEAAIDCRRGRVCR